MVTPVVEKINRENQKDDVPEFAIGDTVRVHHTIHEGDKTRVQIFAGAVIARDGGSGEETFTVRRISHGVGVEKVFPVHSPVVGRVEVLRSGHVRRAKLYFLRDRAGKKARLREKIKSRATGRG